MIRLRRYSDQDHSILTGSRVDGWRDGPTSVVDDGEPLDGVCLMSPEGSVLRLSETAGAILGAVGVEAQVGRRFTELLDPGAVDDFDRTWKRSIESGRTAQCVLRGGRSTFAAGAGGADGRQ